MTAFKFCFQFQLAALQQGAEGGGRGVGRLRLQALDQQREEEEEPLINPMLNRSQTTSARLTYSIMGRGQGRSLGRGHFTFPQLQTILEPDSRRRESRVVCASIIPCRSVS